MTSVTFPPALGGDGSTVTDDANATTGLANGGHRTRFVVALAQAVAVMSGAVSQATAQVAAALGWANAASSSATAAANSAMTALNAPGTTATSTTSTPLATGAKTITIQTGKSIVPGMQVMVANTASPATQYMRGTVTAYNTGTGQLDISMDYAFGTGTIAAWTVSLTGAMDPTRAPLASPALTGVPTAPTAAPGNSTAQLATTAFVTAADVHVTTYTDRASLRALTPAADALMLIESLGLFRWVSASTEPDDDETAFATASGVWELVAADPDYVWASGLSEAMDESFLRGSFVMSLTTLAATISSAFTVSIPGAAQGDSVIVNPGDGFGTSAADQGRLSYAAYVSATDTVTVSIRNASAAAATLTASTWSVLVIKQ